MNKYFKLFKLPEFYVQKNLKLFIPLKKPLNIGKPGKRSGETL